MKYSITVKPGSKQEGIEVLSHNTFVVKTHKRAQNGEANQAVIELLAKHLHVAKTRITIIKGHTAKHKIIEVT